MSFDATAISTERKAGNARLPAAGFFFTGFERATNVFKTSSGITVEFRQQPGQQPTVTLRDVPDLPGIHIYYATQFLDCAATQDTFSIGASWDDQRDVVIQASDVQAIAALIAQQVDPAQGGFAVQWIAIDPSVPF